MKKVSTAVTQRRVGNLVNTFTQTVTSLNFNPPAVRRRTTHYQQLQ
jgi:hypothetical protein